MISEIRSIQIYMKLLNTMTWFCVFELYTCYEAIIADLFPIKNVQQWMSYTFFFIQSMQWMYSGGEPLKAIILLIENVQE